MLTIDLHLHTTYSDGKLPLSKVINLCGAAGLDAIAITDHLCATSHILGKTAKLLNITLSASNWGAYTRELEKERNRAWREFKMLVFTGVEFTRNTFTHGRNAHMLAVDVEEFIDPSLGEEDWLKAAKKQGAMTVAAHPLKLKDAASQTYYLIDNSDVFAPLIDVWEAANARTLWREMLRTPYALMASSDFHIASRWAAWRTVIDCEKDPEAIKEHLKNPMCERTFAFVYGSKHEVRNTVIHQKPGLSHSQQRSVS